MKFLATTAILLSCVSAVCADEATQRAERLLRAGDAAGALATLPGPPQSPEAAFWKGRALVALQRYAEADSCLAAVPPEHKLADYARRARIYCAHSSPNISRAFLADMPTDTPEYELTRLEYELGNGPFSAAQLARLDQLAAQNPGSAAPLLLRAAHHMRCGEFDKAGEICRSIETSARCTRSDREKARLLTGEIYYAEEAALHAAQQDGEDEPNEALDNIEGKGEETVLQFIAANAESPLLENAFRKLMTYRSTCRLSPVAEARLREWSEDMTAPRRAAAALLCLRHIRESRRDAVPTSLSAMGTARPSRSSAATELVVEQVRSLMDSGRYDEVDDLLALLPEDSPYRRFYALAAECQQIREHQMTGHDAEGSSLPLEESMAFLQTAPETLLPYAVQNAYLCALYNQAPKETKDYLRSLAVERPELEAELRLLESGYLLARMDEGGSSAEEIAPTVEENTREVLRVSARPHTKARARLQQAACCLALHRPQEALAALRNIRNTGLKSLTHQEELRLCALSSQAIGAQSENNEAERAAQALRHADTARNASLRNMLLEHAACLFSEAGHHAEAASCLRRLINHHPRSAMAMRMRLFLARELELCGNLPALKAAARQYKECSSPGLPYSTDAAICAASVMARINRCKEAIALLTPLVETKPGEGISQENYITANSVLADIYVLSSEPEAYARALQYAEQAKGCADAAGDRAASCFQSIQLATICSYFGHTEEALQHYRRAMMGILARKEASAPTADEWRLLYTAGAGATTMSYRLGQFDEAAALASRIAHAFPEYGEAGGPRADVFLQVAASIRQKHYIPGQDEESLRRAVEEALKEDD
ncbi:MAG: hypothetical protein ACI4OZ_01825 [Akkermansia sp.]